MNTTDNKYIQDMQWRYATKVFDTSKKVSNEDIQEIIKVFQLTASSFGLQPWKLFIIENEDLKKELQKVSWNQEHVGNNSHLLVFAQDTKVNKNLVDKNLDRMAEVQNITRDDLKGFEEMLYNFMENTPEDQKQQWARDQVFIALGNVMSFLASKKIDSCAIGGFSADDYNKILGLSDKGYSATVVLPIGYRSEDDKYKDHDKVRFKKDEISEIIS